MNNTVQIIYTDGSCVNNQYKTNNTNHIRKGGIGIYFGPDDPRNTSATLDDNLIDASNNRAEIYANCRNTNRFSIGCKWRNEKMENKKEFRFISIIVENN